MKRKTRERVAFLLSLFFHAFILLFFLNKNVNEKIFTPPSLGRKEAPRISLRNFSLLENKQNENSAPSPLIANNLAQEPIISQNSIESKAESKIKAAPQKAAQKTQEPPQDSIKKDSIKKDSNESAPPKEIKQEPQKAAQKTQDSIKKDFDAAPPQSKDSAQIQKAKEIIESKRQEAIAQKAKQAQKQIAKQEPKEPPQDSIKKDSIKKDSIESAPPKEIKQEPQKAAQKTQEPPQDSIKKDSIKKDSIESKTQEIKQEPPRQAAKAQLPRYANMPLLAPNIQDLEQSTPSNGDGTLIRAARELYGESFESLSQSERKFIENNLQNIGKITQRYLRYPRAAGRLGQSGDNIVEFYLHPNGDISELKLISQSGYSMLDENSIHTIRLAYKDYPYPSERTLIRIRVFYFLR